MSISASATACATAPFRLCAIRAISAGKAVGQFLYGDDTRTHRSICFAYGCIALYLLAVINASSLAACG